MKIFLTFYLSLFVILSLAQLSILIISLIFLGFLIAYFLYFLVLRTLIIVLEIPKKDNFFLRNRSTNISLIALKIIGDDGAHLSLF